MITSWSVSVGKRYNSLLDNQQRLKETEYGSYRRDHLIFYLAPHADYNSYEHELHEPVTGMDGSHLQWYFFPYDGTHPLHSGKPDPQQDANPNRTHPVDVPDKPDKVREHQGEDETLRNHNEHFPWLPFLHSLGKGGASLR